MRLIDADSLINLVTDSTILGDGFKTAFCALVNGEPTVEVQKTGKWTKETKHYKDQFQEFNYYTIKCSVCGSAPGKNWHLTNYCPNCGAKMMGE